MTFPLRVTLHQLKRGSYAVKLIKPAIYLGGGWKLTIKKALNLYRHSGLSGIKAGFRKVSNSFCGQVSVVSLLSSI